MVSGGPLATSLIWELKLSLFIYGHMERCKCCCELHIAQLNWKAMYNCKHQIYCSNRKLKRRLNQQAASFLFLFIRALSTHKCWILVGLGGVSHGTREENETRPKVSTFSPLVLHSAIEIKIHFTCTSINNNSIITATSTTTPQINDLIG